MYRAGKHNAADASSRQLNYASDVEENNCLPMLQSELKAMRTVTPESLESPRGKPNEADCAEHMSSMTTLVGHKLAI